MTHFIQYLLLKIRLRAVQTIKVKTMDGPIYSWKLEFDGMFYKREATEFTLEVGDFLGARDLTPGMEDQDFI